MYGEVAAPFSKGQSGNPGGRRKKTAEDIEIQQLARQHGATAIDTLVKIATKGKSESRSSCRGDCPARPRLWKSDPAG